MRATDPRATLSRAQFEVARANGYASWRALIAAIADRRLSPAAPAADLFAAISSRDVVRVRALLDAGADPEQRYGEAGHTALSWAITLDALGVAAVLLEGGARADLYCAAAVGDLTRVRSFFTPEGSLTADAGSTCRVRFLSSAVPHQQRPVGGDLVSEAMYAAVRHSRIDVARFLIDRGVNLRSFAFHGATLLHWACHSASHEIVDLLLAHGADRDARDFTFGCSPRAFAICVPARLGAVDLVAERLAGDPSLATINEGRGTPLHEAARASNEAIVRLLLAHGADPGARDEAGRTPGDLAGHASGNWVEEVLL
jgi:ankyrin repeat protein